MVLPVCMYAASMPELNTVQQFLRRCHKHHFISYAIYIYTICLKKQTGQSLKKISYLPTHPLYNMLPRVKDSSKYLRTQTSLLPCVNTERFKASFINRLFKIYFYFLTNNIRHVNICMFLYLYIQ